MTLLKEEVLTEDENSGEYDKDYVILP
jgi:hypothetical protein